MKPLLATLYDLCQDVVQRSFAHFEVVAEASLEGLRGGDNVALLELHLQARPRVTVKAKQKAKTVRVGNLLAPNARENLTLWLNRP